MSANGRALQEVGVIGWSGLFVRQSFYIHATDTETPPRGLNY